MNMKQEDKFEKRIRFVAKHYREDKLDTDKAWQQFAATNRIPRRFALPRYLLAAASVILILLLARIGYVHINDTGNWMVVSTEKDNRKSYCCRIAAACCWPEVHRYDMIRNNMEKSGVT